MGMTRMIILLIGCEHFMNTILFSPLSLYPLSPSLSLSLTCINSLCFFPLTILMNCYCTVIQTVHCLTEKEFTDPDLGSFSMNRSLYCNPKCGKLTVTKL